MAANACQHLQNLQILRYVMNTFVHDDKGSDTCIGEETSGNGKVLDYRKPIAPHQSHTKVSNLTRSNWHPDNYLHRSVASPRTFSICNI